MRFSLSWRIVRPRAFVLALTILALALAALCGPGAFAVSKIVRLTVTDDAIDLASAVEYFAGAGDKLQVATAPGPDGIVRRIEVGALQAGTNPYWAVFSLVNDTDEQLTRLLVAPHYRFVGSGVVWPDLGSARIATITASQGNPPEREDVAEADAFLLTIDPGTTVTYVAELRTPRLPQVYLWEPDAYKANLGSLTLFRGIVIGIAGLLALFMTIVFVVRGVLVFPAAAALAWAVFVYVCIDFGFWREDFRLRRRHRTHLAGGRRSLDRRDADRVPFHLPELEPVACALPAHRPRLDAGDGDCGRAVGL